MRLTAPWLSKPAGGELVIAVSEPRRKKNAIPAKNSTAIERHFEELTGQMADPAIISDSAQLSQRSKMQKRSGRSPWASIASGR